MPDGNENKFAGITYCGDAQTLNSKI